MDYLTALYVFLLTGIIGFAFVSKVPSILQTTFLSASSLMNGLALIAAILALSNAQTQTHIIIACVAVIFASANVVGSFLITQNTSKILTNSRSDTESGDQ